MVQVVVADFPSHFKSRWEMKNVHKYIYVLMLVLEMRMVMEYTQWYAQH